MIIKGKTDFIVFSDAHFGPRYDNEHRFKETSFVRQYAYENGVTAIFDAGDHADTAMSITSIAGQWYIKDINAFATMKTKFNTPMEYGIVKGTESHDENQLRAFGYLESDPNLKVRIFEEKTNYMLDGIKFKIMPEEYMPDKDKFYKEFLAEHHHFNIFHGMCGFAATGHAFGDNCEVSPPTAPVFNQTDFTNTEHAAIGGHIHIPLAKGKVFYCGSLSRMSQGEEEPKGFWHITYYHDTNTYEKKFILNPFVLKYVTISIDINMLRQDTVAYINHIKDYKHSSMIYKLRIEYSDPELETDKDFLVFKKYFINHSRLDVSFLNKIPDRITIQKDGTLTNEKKESDLHPILHDENVSVEAKTSYYARVKKDKEISETEIKGVFERAMNA